MGFKYTYTKEQYVEVMALATVGFTMREVSRRTEVPYDTVRGWVKRGYKPLNAWTEEDWARKKGNSQATRDEWSDEKRVEFLAKCKDPKMGENNPMWVGDDVSVPDIARSRIRRKYKAVIELLVELSGVKWDIHHIDGNPLNNDDDNLSISTRKGHMEIDGRLEKMREMFTEFNRKKGGG
jgi:hypothetical protein